MATRKTKPPSASRAPDPDPFASFYLSPEQVNEYQVAADMLREQQRKADNAVIPKPQPSFIPVHTPAALQRSEQRPPMGSDEATAWRHVVNVLSKTATPAKRQVMADVVSDFIRGRCSDELGLELPDVAKLFHPDGAEAADAVLIDLQQACESGALRSHDGVVFMSELAVWPECPPMAAASPLRFWLPFAPFPAGATVLELTKTADSPPKLPTTWAELVPYRKANPGHLWPVELKNIVAAERFRRGAQPGAAAAMAAELGISVTTLNQHIAKKDEFGKRQTPTSTRTGTS